MGIQSGNHWIKLASSGNTFQILHAAPGYNVDDKATYTTIQGCVVKDEEPSKDLSKPVLMGWGKEIIVPVISYDAAGHIIPTDETTYLQMPLNPTDELEGRMQQIDGKNAEGKDEEPAGGKSLKTELYARMQQIDGKNAEGQDTNGQSLKKNLYARMKAIDGKNEDGTLDASYSSVKKELEDLVEDLNSKLSNLDKAIEDSGNALSKATEAYNQASAAITTFGTLNETIGALQDEVEKLKEQINGSST